MHKKNLILKAIALSVLFVGITQADILPVHATTQWQSIGKETIATDGSSNNGVFYSINGGTSWLNLSNGVEFSVGQTVDFKVEIYKEFQGTHYSDVAKVWLDGIEMDADQWLLSENGNQKAFVKKDSIYTKAIDKITEIKNRKGRVVRYDTTYKYIKSYTYDTTYYKYYDGNVVDGSQNPVTNLEDLTYLGSVGFSKTFTEAKDYELIARTMCSDDLAGVVSGDGSTEKISYIWTDGNVYTKDMKLPTEADWAAFTSSNPLWSLQGEIEKCTFKVVKRDVPEPTSLSLMLLGLTSLGGALFIRRKK